MTCRMTVTTDRMHPEDSAEWAHATRRVSSVYMQAFLCSILFMTIGFYFFSTDFQVAPDNYTLLAHSYRADYTHMTTITFDEVISSMNPKHPLHKILARDYFRYSFGTVFKNHCYLFPYPEGYSLPSLLRRMTFSAPAQVAMRTAVLVSITVRMVTTMCRSADILMQNTAKASQIRCLSCLCSVADLLTSILGMFVTCLHDGIDSAAMGFLVYYALPLFGVSFFTSGVLYTSIEYYDSKRKSTRVLERVFCLALFVLCLPVVTRDYISFLLSKPCLYHVDCLTAICEYTCIASIVVFYLTQVEDFTKMEMVLSTEKVETMCCMDCVDFPDYKPAMLHDFHKMLERQKALEESRLRELELLDQEGELRLSSRSHWNFSPGFLTNGNLV
ncbi:unnamed protein product [Caenorhabditis sp. 36 PRJEB53466]|nr:unnamed protein product [Caenorhabditis sp. 36 PRJEB53466]